MEQTFNDLYKERQREGGWFGFVLWTFFETAGGIVREHVLLATEGVTMKTVLANPGTAAVISFILYLPAAIIFLFDVIGVSQDFWPLPISPDIVVPVAFLLLPVALLVSGAPLKLPAIISFLIVLPFMILELVNRWRFNEGFPIPLFVFMWLLVTIFVAVLIPIVQNVRAGNNLLSNPIGLLLRITFLTVIAVMWVSWIVDQMPCFLGVPNCD